MWNNRRGISGMCHFSIPVSDIELSLDYYKALLGADVYEDDLGPYLLGMNEGDPGYGYRPHLFLEVGRTKIELAQLPTDDERRAPGGTIWRWGSGETPVGTHHAFGIGPHDLLPMCEWLADVQVPFWGPKTHPHTHTASIYVQDWDGNEIEFCVWDGFPGAEQLPLRDERWLKDRGFRWDPGTQRATPNIPFEWDPDALVAQAKSPASAS